VRGKRCDIKDVEAAVGRCAGELQELECFACALNAVAALAAGFLEQSTRGAPDRCDKLLDVTKAFCADVASRTVDVAREIDSRGEGEGETRH
jgi:hypothetical protein